MALWYETRKFKKLHEKWMRRLAQENFHDIERGSHHGTVIEDLCHRVHFHSASVEATTAYFTWASSVTHGRRYQNSRFMRRSPRKRIWRLHLEGKNNSEIGRMLHLSRWSIENYVKEIRAFLERK